MMSYDFQTITHGKWILAGEHAVIRGHQALVFPIKEKMLTLSYYKSTSELSANYEGNSGADTHLLFWSVLEQGMHLLGRSLNSLSGHFNLRSNVPVGVGMGASAALCVAMARWFAGQNLIDNNQIKPFAQQLEHLFHGQSSGLDIAGVSATSGICFQQGISTPIKQTWQPQWYLSSCGQIGITSHCIQQVQALWDNHPDIAQQIDDQMATCVQEIQTILEAPPIDATEALAKRINHAADCFQRWGLVSESLQHHMHSLREAGACAVKPTGSGGGGYVLSLWHTQPPPLPMELIAI